MKQIICALALICTSTAALADAPVAEPKVFSVVFKPLRGETAYEETAWQLLNVIDGLQSVQIARNPKCYAEVGTPEYFGVGSHPSVATSVAFTVVFAGAHWGVTRILENFVDDDDSVRNLQRVWQGVSLVTKAATVVNNHNIGLGLTSSHGC